MKFRPVGAEFFHADRRTDGSDMTKLIVSFRKSAKAPKYCFEGVGFVLGYATLQKKSYLLSFYSADQSDLWLC